MSTSNNPDHIKADAAAESDPNDWAPSADEMAAWAERARIADHREDISSQLTLERGIALAEAEGIAHASGEVLSARDAELWAQHLADEADDPTDEERAEAAKWDEIAAREEDASERQRLEWGIEMTEVEGIAEAERKHARRPPSPSSPSP